MDWNGEVQKVLVTAPPAQSLQLDQLSVVFWTESKTIAVAGGVGREEAGVEVVEPVVPVDVPVVAPEPDEVVEPVDEVVVPEPDEADPEGADAVVDEGEVVLVGEAGVVVVVVPDPPLLAVPVAEVEPASKDEEFAPASPAPLQAVSRAIHDARVAIPMIRFTRMLLRY